MDRALSIPMIDFTHAADATSWVSGADAHPEFPIQNLPLGLFCLLDGQPRVASRIGEHVIDLRGFASEKLLPSDLAVLCCSTDVNPLLSAKRDARRRLRYLLFGLLTDTAKRDVIERHLHPVDKVQMLVPAHIGDYTDFYVGIHHATNIGKLFRPDNPLLPNYKHVPIGYHGRASSIRASGADVRRPSGQRKPPENDTPLFGPSQRLDYELELGVWISGHNDLGDPVAIDRAADHFAGLCLLNDWSARDVQAWEYQPLGPFLSKNFQTNISPWIITAEALTPFRVAQPPRAESDPRPLPYLWDDEDQRLGAFSIQMDVAISTSKMREIGLEPQLISSGGADAMYWTVAQMITHHTVNGCNLNAGDLLGTGTLSGAPQTSWGSLMELSQGGKEPLTLATGEQRCFLEDGDEVTFTAEAHAPGYRSIGFGTCTGRII